MERRTERPAQGDEGVVPPNATLEITLELQELVVVPPNSSVYYEVEVVSFEKEKESWDMNTQEKIEAAWKTRMQVEARHLNHHHPTKLFAFGDSYADTGNTRKDEGGSWLEPYGITFPGKPAGRWSDGRVLTDYIEELIKHKVYTASDLNNSVTLVAVSGNDYNFYLARNGSIQNLLKPCCYGVTSDYNCGSVVNNEKKYELCDKPKSAFFWDGFHPTQAGMVLIVKD
ncbi:unnamed protein product [Lupinus luteus]|uniref:GDSL esterase/lipase n=1 Tax=Lupinus luteus TaxID=3873 RepID=A0AAV1VR67_LUPLU